MIARTWGTRASALTMFVLIASTLHLGVQGETTQVGSGSGTSANQQSDTGHHYKGETNEIKWESVRDRLEAELKAGIEDAEEVRIRYEEDGPLMGVVYMECLGKTDEVHGLKRLHWDLRKTWTIGLLKDPYSEGVDKYKIVKAEESVEWRAPAGDWRVQHAYSRHVQASSMGQVFTGKPKPKPKPD